MNYDAKPFFSEPLMSENQLFYNRSWYYTNELPSP